MPRVKIRSIQSVSSSAPEPITWAPYEAEVLTANIGLDHADPRHRRKCKEVLLILANTCGNYLAWQDHDKDYPRQSNRAKEIESAIPYLEKAFNVISRLSYAVRQDIKNAGPVHINASEQLGPSIPNKDTIDAEKLQMQAMNALTHLLRYMKMAQAGYPKEKRGRSRSPLWRLTEITGHIFDEYYKGTTRDRQASKIRFNAAILKYIKCRSDERVKLRSKRSANIASR